MIDKPTYERLLNLCSKPVALGGWLGLPYEENGCLKFAIKFYKEMGIDTDENAMREARHFIDVIEPRFGDLAIFHNSPTSQWHVGIMMDRRRMVHCSEINGVGNSPYDIYPWIENFRGFKRHHLCF